MILGKVIGNVVSTIKEIGYSNRKIMIVQPILSDGKVCGKSFLAIDTVQAGVGDTVITIEEGGSARIALSEPDTFTVKLIIAGIVDNVTLE